MKPKIHYLSLKEDVPSTGYWDHTFICDNFADLKISSGNRDVVVIPVPYQTDVIPEINKFLSQFKKVMVILTSDEEHKFNETLIEHPDMILYSQYGNGGKMFPLGYSPKTREFLKEIGLQDKKGWFFAGQITHPRRKMLAKELKKLNKYKDCLIETDGFAKGLDRKMYFQGLSKAKFAPCSPGPISVDSFRLYESLEAGCIPIADDTSPIRSAADKYWLKLFGKPLFPVFNEYTQLGKIMDYYDKLPYYSNRVFAWYINWKHQFKQGLKTDLGIPKDKLFVTIPVSPIPSHPSTEIIEETINSIRVHTDATILVTIDGVRDEQKHMEEDYSEFIRRFLWKCNFEYKNVLPVLFGKHTHQARMMKEVCKNVDIPVVLYVEHDTPLTPDMEIPMDNLVNRILNEESNLIRFHFESLIPEPHKYLMIGKPNDGLLKTIQWSQRPHLASMDYYKRIMNDNFSEECNTFIEDRMHSICQSQPWENNKLHIYHPEGNIKRSYHLDGRNGIEKYDNKLKY